MQDYETRFSILLIGNQTQQFFNPSGTLVATGYTRIVIGGRGPYVEFELDQLNLSTMSVPPGAERRQAIPAHYYYLEYRTNDTSFTKVYVQTKTVDYADYKVGKAYVSPFDLLDADGNTLIENL